MFELESQSAPSAPLQAVRRVLGAAVCTGVQQLVGHLQSIAPVLVAREGWQLSLTHSGDLPVTLLPEQLQVSRPSWLQPKVLAVMHGFHRLESYVQYTHALATDWHAGTQPREHTARVARSRLGCKTWLVTATPIVGTRTAPALRGRHLVPYSTQITLQLLHIRCILLPLCGCVFTGGSHCGNAILPAAAGMRQRAQQQRS
jgi:hypothetical protein